MASTRLRRISNHRLEFSQKIHTTYGETITTPSEINKRWPVTGFTMPQRTPTRVKSNEVSSGHGNEFDAVIDETQVASAFSMEMELEPESAAAMWLLALGDLISTAGTGADYANRYIHTVGCITTLDLPTTSIRSADGETASLWWSMAVEKIRTSGSPPKGTAIKMNVDMFGSGKRTDDVVAAAAASRLKKCRMRNFKLVLGVEGTAEGSMTDVTDRVESFELSFENGKGETHRADTSGTGYANTAEHSGARKAMLKLTLSKNASASLNALVELDPRSATAAYGCYISCYADDHAVTGSGTARLLKWYIPQMIVTAASNAEAGANMAWDLEFSAIRNPSGDDYDANHQGPLVLYIDNGTAASVHFQAFTV